jgi:deoxypyrimidine-specific 5' nucleotidase type C protein (NT5C)
MSVVRVGFDMDGVLADFSSAFRDIETRLFGAGSALPAEAPEVEARQEEQAGRQGPAGASPRESRRRRDAVWTVIHETPDFWMTLRPHDPMAVRRIHEMMLRHRLEVFFITQRPATVGQTVQRQTQQWLRQQGFDLPSVLVISGSRGAAAGAIRLDYHVDDSPQNCLDVVSDSRARPILIVPEPDAVTENSAKRLRIGVARSIGQALDILEHTLNGGNDAPRLLDKLSRMVGRK